MSQVVRIRKFTKFFALYALVSLVGCFTTAFTIPAWLIYWFILSPFYFVCILYLLNFYLKHRQGTLRYPRSPLYLSVVFQFLMILASPADCGQWKQSEACYSFIQAQWSNHYLTDLQSAPTHWHLVEGMFFPAMLLHMIFVAACLKAIQIEQSNLT
jgi:hypothetical protein